jgi:hypothetical protein
MRDKPTWALTYKMRDCKIRVYSYSSNLERARLQLVKVLCGRAEEGEQTTALIRHALELKEGERLVGHSDREWVILNMESTLQ